MGTSADRTAIVREMYAHMSGGPFDPNWLADLFTDDAYIQMMMKDPYAGKAEILGMFTIWSSGYSGVDMRLRSVVGEGDKVMTEWLDVSDHGGVHYEIPCASAVDFDADDKITAWRIYYDYAAEAGQNSGLKPRKGA